MAYTKNMTEGNPFPIIFSYFIPILCSTLFQLFYNLVVTVIVGKGIDDMALAAVGTTGAITFFIFGFILGLTSGMSVLMAQAYGAGNYQSLRKTITMGVISCGIVGIIFMICSITFARPLLVLLNTSEMIIDNAVLYVVIILSGIPLTMLYNCFSGILNALGDSKTPLYAVVLSSIINILLDLLFILVFHMGVDGAAYATVIAQLFSGIICYLKVRKIDFVRIHREDWKLDFSLIFRQFKIGVPVAFMNSVTAIGALLLQYFVNRLGVTYTATYSACSRIVQLMMQSCSAVGMTMSTYAGQNLGAGKINRIRQGLKSGFLLSFTLTVITTSLLLLIPQHMVSLMLNDASIITLSTGYLRVCGAMMWAISTLFLTRSICQGMGNTFIPMLSGFYEFAARVFVVYFLISKFGFTTIALEEVTAWTGALAMNGIYLLIKLKSLKRKREKSIFI